MYVEKTEIIENKVLSINVLVILQTASHKKIKSQNTLSPENSYILEILRYILRKNFKLICFRYTLKIKTINRQTLLHNCYLQLQCQRII